MGEVHAIRLDLRSRYSKCAVCVIFCGVGLIQVVVAAIGAEMLALTPLPCRNRTSASRGAHSFSIKLQNADHPGGWYAAAM